jgi:hypothetical protein
MRKLIHLSVQKQPETRVQIPATPYAIFLQEAQKLTHTEYVSYANPPSSKAGGFKN